MQKRFIAITGGISILLVLIFITCSPRRNLLQQVQHDGVLRVLTRTSPTTYFNGPHGTSGLEYDLITAFAKHLGVKADIRSENNLQDILKQVESGRVQIAAAGLTITEQRKKRVRFTPAYQYITQQLIYRTGAIRPRNVNDLLGGNLEVIANSSHAERLKMLKHDIPALKWHENATAKSSDLLALVAEQLIDFTIADSNEAALHRRYHPELRVAFDISKTQGLAWALRAGKDDSLYREAQNFFNSLRKSGKLEKMLAQYYSHVRTYNYAGTPTYLRHIKQRMRRYQPMFERAALDNNLDWRLLAAVSYQESNWNPHAVSPTGVRGLMMLTRVTAKQLGIKKRTDPAQSIEGGARYIRSLYRRFPEVPEPDRTWMTLAAYNIGFGHVKDARAITAERGGNENKWTDVKKSLPLLRLRKWYKNTQYGYARGHEPVRYVENIRSYYDILRWRTERETPSRNNLAFSSPVL